MDRTKRKAIFKMQRQVVGIAVLLIAVVFVAKNCQWKRHYVEGRNIPRTLAVNVNQHEDIDAFRCTIEVLYTALPEKWYCTEWGGGGGPKAAHSRISYAIEPNTRTISIPLIYPNRSFCPYALFSVCILIRGDDSDSNFDRSHICFAAPEDNFGSGENLDTPPDTINVSYCWNDSTVTLLSPRNEWHCLPKAITGRNGHVVIELNRRMCND